MAQIVEHDFKKGECLTGSGKIFSYLNPTPDMIDINDIAVSLSRECRFCGQMPLAYSVAQHSCIIADLVSDCGLYHGLAGLLHDAPEAYIRDLPSPLKELLKPIIGPIERKIALAIWEHFGLPTERYDEISKEVKIFDEIVYKIECDQLRDYSPRLDLHLGKYSDIDIYPWSECKAEKEFRTSYAKYM